MPDLTQVLLKFFRKEAFYCRNLTA